MIGSKNLLNMIYTEAITGEDLSCRDYIRNMADLPREIPSMEKKQEYNENLEPISYRTRLIEFPNGKLEWIEFQDNYPLDHLRNPDGSIKS